MTGTLNFPLEIQALSERQFSGHGSVFGNVDLGGDVVIPGAFKATLAAHNKAGTMPAMFWMHKPDQVAGAWLDMREDAKGLLVKGELADTTLGREMQTLLKMKAVRGLSIGFRTVDSDFTKDGVRQIKEVDLWEVSIVSMAMNPLARVEAAKARLSELGEWVPTIREFEGILREAGCSRAVARRLAGKMFDDEMDGGMPGHSRQRDAGDVESEDEAELLKAIHGLTDKIGSAALSR
jgi:HK97 family phage prohead protease